MEKKIEVILFDLGGVLIELTGVSVMLGWMDESITIEMLWQRWLTSPTVRAFETGQLHHQEFAERLIEEMSLAVNKDDFIEEFTWWPRGLFPGTLELVNSIPSVYTLAVLSNSNPIHWPRMLQELGRAGRFNHFFASHLMGKIKPDIEVFEHVLDELDCEPGRILYVDDNRLNVEAARSLGIQAVETKGIEAVSRVFKDYGII